LSKKNKHRKSNKGGSILSVGLHNASALTWISASLFILGLGVLAGIYWEMNSNINEVRFTGNYFTEDNELAGTFEAPLGVHPDSVSFIEIIEAVQSLPYVKDAGIHVDAGGRMYVEVSERKPLAMLIHDGNRLYIDENGVKIPVILKKSVNVPLLHGFPAAAISDTLKGGEFEFIRDFLVAAEKNEFGWITISEVAYSPEEGVIALSHENGVKLLFGHDEYEQKVRYWEAFYSEIIKKRGISQFASVDLRYKNQIVTRQL
jgi:cell division protein FtsQ